ncbi:MAG: hypothetical protein IT340_09670 [Chloroflexi bacterium]|nr:hypothetical protein [Chloroflexota bacterium]
MCGWRQRWVAVVGGLLIGLLLAGCGAGPADGAGAAGAARPTDPPPSAAAVQAAVAEAARLHALEPGRVRVISVTAMEWPDTALGCPQPGRIYAQVITPGWRIHLMAGGQAVAVHTNSSGSALIACDRP